MRCPNLALIFITFCLLFVFGFGTDEDVVTSPPLADTSIQAPISTKTNVSRTAPDEILKQSIQAKVKKLRQLKLEARQLSSQLRRERRIKAADGISKEERVMKLQKWKSRMRKRVKALIKRVNRLEQVMKIRKAELQSVKRKQHQLISTTVMPVGVAVIPQRKNKSHKGLGKKGHKQPPTTLAPAVLTTLASTSATITTSTIPSTAHSQTPVLTTQKSKTISKRSHIGVDGNPCETHKDCAPGHCCHRFGALHGANAAVCIRHDTKEGSHCEHSCACMGSLKCVKAKNPRTHSTEQAHCRRLTPQEFAVSTSHSSPKSHSNNRYHLRYF